VRRYLVILVSIFILSACSNKDRLANSTLLISVLPSGTPVVVDHTQQFTANMKNAKGEIITGKVKWAVASGVGTINESGIYTAPSSVSVPQDVEVTATYSGVIGTSKFRVLSSANEVSSSRYYFFADEYPSSVYNNKMIVNPSPVTGNKNEGTIENQGWVNANLIESKDVVYEGFNAIKVVNYGADTGGGVTFRFINTSNNLSMYAGGKLCFAIKTFYDINIQCSWLPVIAVPSLSLSSYYPLSTFADGNWHFVTIPLSDFTGMDLSKFTQLTFYVPGANDHYFYIDYIYFEK
jgi:hypothetical protein